MITNDIKYVGVNDHDIDLFEGQYDVPNGMAYNSYLILDEKVAVMDSVDIRFADQWIGNIKEILSGTCPDYLIVQHMEPDHSSSIMKFVESFLGSKLIIYGGWMLVSYVLFLVISLFLLSYGETYIIGEQKVDSIEMLMTQMLDFPSKKQLVAYAIYYATEIFTTLLTFVSVVYFAISLSHIRVFQKASLIWAVLIFFAVSIFMAWLASKPSDFINIILQFKADGSVGFGIVKPGFEFAEGTMPFDISGMIASLLECVALFFATSHIMHKRVNIK